MSPPHYFSSIFNKYFKYSKSLKLAPANCLISLAVLGPLAKIITSIYFLNNLTVFYSQSSILSFSPRHKKDWKRQQRPKFS